MTQQKDGTFLPSADLMSRVPANPQQYPATLANRADAVSTDVAFYTTEATAN